MNAQEIIDCCDGGVTLYLLDTDDQRLISMFAECIRKGGNIFIPSCCKIITIKDGLATVVHDGL